MDNPQRAHVSVLDGGTVRVDTVSGFSLPGEWDFAVTPEQTVDIRIAWYKDNELVLMSTTGDGARLSARARPGGTALLEWSASEITEADTAPNIRIQVPATTTDDYSGWLQARYQLIILGGSGRPDLVLLEGFVTLNKQVYSA